MSKWIGHAVDDGLSTNQALTELRGCPVPWQADDAKTMAAETKLAKAGTSKARPTPK